jgi:ADP-ribose pyrophosphatase YjhB (NUDIX family)
MMKRPKPIDGFKKFIKNRRPAIDEVVREPTAGGVVFRRSKKNQDKIEILLIQDSKERWTIPKGHIEEGETARQTAEREIRWKLVHGWVRSISVTAEAAAWY